MLFTVAMNPTSSQINLYTIDFLAIDSASSSISSFKYKIIDIFPMKSESSSNASRSCSNYKYLGLVLLHMIIILI